MTKPVQESTVMMTSAAKLEESIEVETKGKCCSIMICTARVPPRIAQNAGTSIMHARLHQVKRVLAAAFAPRPT
jgi:hypothetical protein